MELTEIGTMLRKAREQKGLTVEAVEERIKIGQAVIVAFEEGNKDRFPHPVYARGFLRSYALLLGLDASELCTHFTKEHPVPLDGDPPEVRSLGVSVRSSRHNVYGAFLPWVIAILGVLVLGIGGWYVYGLYEDGWGKRVVNATSIKTGEESASLEALSNGELPVAVILDKNQDISNVQKANASIIEENATIEQEPGTPDEAGALDQEPPAQEATATQSTEAEDIPKTTDKTKEEASDKTQDLAQTEKITVATVDASGKHSLVIKAHAASWLQARPDDSVTDYFLRKGESATINFSSSLTVKFGNAGGVALELDGQPYPFEAQLGEVRTLVVK